MRRVASADARHRRSPLAAPMPQIIQQVPKNYSAFVKSSPASWEPFSGRPQPGMPVPPKGIKHMRQHADDDNLLPEISETERDMIQSIPEADFSKADLLENFHSELMNAMTELQTSLTQVLSDVKRDVLAESKKDILEIRSDLRQFKTEMKEVQKSSPESQVSAIANDLTAMRGELRELYRSTSSDVLSEIQRTSASTTSEIQNIMAQKQDDLKPVMQRIDDLQSNVNTNLLELGTKLDSGLLPSVLQKMDDVQTVILEQTLEAIEEIRELEADTMKNQGEEMAAVRKSMVAFQSESTTDLQTVLKEMKLGFNSLNKTLKPKVFFQSLEERMDTVQTTIISQVTATLEPALQDIKGNVDKVVALDSKIEKYLDPIIQQMTENHSVHGDNHSKIMEQITENHSVHGLNHSKTMEQITETHSKVEKELESIVNKIGALDAKVETKQDTSCSSILQAVENVKVQLDSKQDTSCSSILQAVENVRVREEDLLPVITRIDSLKKEIDFAPVLHEIGSLKTTLTDEVQTAFVSKIDDVRTAIDKANRRALEAIDTAKIREEDFAPVIKHIDDLSIKSNFASLIQQVDALKSDVLKPVIEKIDATQVAVVEKTSAEMRTVSESVVKNSEAVIKNIDSLGNNVQRSIGSLQEKQSPVLGKIDAQCGNIQVVMERELTYVKNAIQKAKVTEEDLQPVLKRLDQALGSTFFTPVLNKVDSVERKIDSVHNEVLENTRLELDRLQSNLVEKICNNVRLEPVLQRIDDLKVDTEFCLPVLQKIDAMQVAVLGLTRKELKPTMEALNKAIDKLKTREADLSSVQRKISELKLSMNVETQKNFGPVMERLEALKVDGFMPVLESIEALKATGAAVLPTVQKVDGMLSGSLPAIVKWVDGMKVDFQAVSPTSLGTELGKIEEAQRKILGEMQAQQANYRQLVDRLYTSIAKN